MFDMQSALALVQAYLRVNGYFTVAEYPVIEAMERGGYRTVTDLDILAFRFPNAGRLIPGAEMDSHEALFEPDPVLGITGDNPDLLIGEVKEGRAELNEGARNPRVIGVALRRFGCCDAADAPAVECLLEAGEAELSSGYRVRLVAFGTSPPEGTDGGFQVILLERVRAFLEEYIRQYWPILRQGQFRDPAFGFLLTLEKIRRSSAPPGE
jgi:hypothetical protein